MGIIQILLSAEFNETVTLIINIATVALAVKFRKSFRSTYPGVGKFYDALLLATIVWFIAECFYAPGYFSDYFSEEFIEKSELIADNIWIVFQLLFFYAFASLFGALINNYRVEVVKEVPKGGENESALMLSPGTHIVFPEKAKELFLSLLKEYPGLVISRTPPEEIKRRLGLKRTPVIWITRVEGKSHVSPTRLEYLGHLVVEFFKENETPKVVLIDCIEYLAIENGFQQVFKFLLNLKDYASVTDSIILLVTSREVWKDREWKLLTREFPVVEG
ncbi:DUF835 domain-containing protein [Thermococcus sp. LS1]|uniref:DUF835 domain-containing protein n=1 Tax=Thermococcus sp. LS1 TaxID=1638259 RepID=UPI00143AC9C7|nr:DUF835 domain-containing protein [Thermococcus sp. LS1]NJD99429.1 DUF835 domain-containing protein [Thermococcus sp. LS1]